MKTITIRLPDVEAAMLEELQRRNRRFRNLSDVLSGVIDNAYRDLSRR